MPYNLNLRQTEIACPFKTETETDNMEQGMSGFYIQPRSSSTSAERNKGGAASMGTGTKCGRWNPTAEQVKVLTDLFRAGLRTPSTEQIQKISTQLSFYGKIESKNVFYWFQNHKARERQKRRRVNKDGNSSSCFHQLQQHLPKPTTTTTRYFGEINDNKVEEGEREIETLELFPMKESEKLSLWMLSRDHCKENNNNNHANFSYTNHDLGKEIENHHHLLHHPPLDLRLSFF